MEAQAIQCFSYEPSEQNMLNDLLLNQGLLKIELAKLMKTSMKRINIVLIKNNAGEQFTTVQLHRLNELYKRFNQYKYFFEDRSYIFSSEQDPGHKDLI